MDDDGDDDHHHHYRTMNAFHCDSMMHYDSDDVHPNAVDYDIVMMMTTKIDDEL